MHLFSLFPIIHLASGAALFRRQSQVKCPVIFDGRVPQNATLSTFDTSASPFSPKYVKGENLTWSSILVLPSTFPSRFDDPALHKPLEVTINDQSLFHPGGNGIQYGFRRAGLLLKDDNNTAGADDADKGVVTFHWSVKQDAQRALNLSHEYMNVWHEKADYSGNQFNFVGGVVLKVDGGDGVDTPQARETWKIQNAKNEFIFATDISHTAWQNFAIQLDYPKSTIQVFYSLGSAPLVNVTAPLANNNTGGGQLQLGIAKKPTETKTVVNDGFQEHINGTEGQIYGGIFVEKSDAGCISL